MPDYFVQLLLHWCILKEYTFINYCYEILGDFIVRTKAFKGWIKEYVNQLSLQGTSSVTKLIGELNVNPRIREPLILHAAISGIPKSIAKVNPEFHEECKKIENMVLHVKPEKYSSVLPAKYHKIIKSYECIANKVENDNHSKILMRNRIIETQANKSISNYKIYTQLNLNAGNVNDF